MLTKIIKYTLLTVIICFLVFSLIELNSQKPVLILRNLIKIGHLNNKNIKLNLNFLNIVPVGEAQIRYLGKERFRNQDLIHIRAEAETIDYIKNIFSAKAVVDSYIDPEELHSIYFLQHLEIINKPDEDKEISYNQNKHTMTYKGRRGVEERIIDEHAQDPLSAIFYIQNKLFNVGEEFKIGMNTNQKNYIIAGRVVSKKEITVAGKDYQVWLVEASVSRKDKSPRHKTSCRIWFVDTDGFKIPILIKAMTNIGPISAKAQ